MLSKFLYRATALCGLIAATNCTLAQSTAFTYQGSLNDGVSAANGSYDLRFALFDAAASGAQHGNSITNAAAAVTNGLFTVTLDFGNQFPGADRWLEIGVRTNGGGDFAPLTPRQPITPTPYAVQSASANSVAAANISGTLDTAQLPGAVVTNGASGVNVSGTFTGNGAGLTDVDLVTANRHGAISFTPRYIGQFAPAPGSPMGNESYWVTAASLTPGGSVDLISVNTTSNTVQVLRNNGSGGFTVFPYVVGSDPRFVTAARVNGHTALDLVTANYGDNTLTVLLNDGGGQFNQVSSPTVGSGPRSVAAADVNGDGKLDLISANSGDNTVTVLIGSGSGNFFPPMSLSVGSDPRSVIAADVNGDGKMDLITANYGDNTLAVLRNNGFGNFLPASFLSVGSHPQCVIAADVNGDGKVDLICANTGNNTLTVLTNNGSGAFTISSSPAVGLEPYAVIAADVNGDGKPDLISANFGSKSLTVLTNNGSGGFVLASSPSAFGKPYSVAAGDVNGDGAVDLICANFAYPLVVQLNAPAYSASFNGDGSGLTSLSGGQITGTIPLAHLPAGLVTNGANAVNISGTFSGNGAALTNLTVNGSQITGTIPWALLPPGLLTNGATGVNLSGIFSGDGAALTNLTVNGSQITGTIPLALLPDGLLTNGATGVSISGAFTGTGAGLTDLNASSISSGTLSDAQLSANVALLAGTNFFTGTNSFAGPVMMAHPNNQLSGTFSGNGAGLTGLNPGSLGAGLAGIDISGNAATASAFSGPLAGDVTGTQSATVVSAVGGQSAANVAGGVSAANAATSANTANTIVKRDATGSFSAGAITATSMSGDGSALTNLNASRLSSGTVADARLSANVALLNSSNLFAGTNRFASTLVATNASNVFGGTFAGTGLGLTSLNPSNLTAGTAAINISGSAASATTATNASNFTGALAGDVTGTQSATVVSAVGSQSAPNIASGVSAANAATSANIAGAIVKRDASGNFSAGAIAATNLVVNGSIAGNGAGLTNLSVSGSQITGTVPLAQLPTAVVTNGATGLTLAGAFAGNASGLTNLSGSQITGAIFGNGSGLTNLNAGALASGTLADARLSTNVALRSGGNTFSGSQQVFDTFFTGTETLDQQQTNSTSAIGSPDQWQSFTAGQSGSLTKIALEVSSPIYPSSSPGTILIYAGEGTAGTLLATQSVTFAPVISTFQTFPLTFPPLVQASNQYTIRFSAPVATSGWVYQAGDVYAGGRASSSASADYLFKTYVTPVTTATILVVNSAVPGGYSGNVGIGTNSPQAKLHVAGNILVSGTITGDGSGLTNLSVSGSRITGTIFGNGSGLTNLSGSQLTGPIFGNGSGLTNLSGSQLTGPIFGNGSGLSNLDAGTLVSGTLADARLSTNVSLRSGGNTFSGSQQVFDTFFSGAEALDQQQTTQTSTAGNADQWQSFTAGQSGALTKIALHVNSPTWPSSSPGTINIYAGEATSGTLLATESVTFAPVSDSFQTFPLTVAPLVQASNLYTIRFSAPVETTGWVDQAGDVYAGGRSSVSASIDFLFKTYVTPVTTGTILMVNPVVTGGHLGNVGIGTNSPQAKLHVAGNILATGTITGDGSGLTNLSGSQISGTVPLAQLPTAVVTNGAAGVTLAGAFTGNGTALTNLITPTIANYVHSYCTNTQIITVINTFQDITNSVDAQISGWAHTPGTVSFTNNQTGLYLIQYTAIAATSVAATTTNSLRAVVNGSEIADSQSTAVAVTANQTIPISKSFITSFISGDILKFQLAGSTLNNRMVANTGFGTNRSSFSFTLFQLQ